MKLHKLKTFLSLLFLTVGLANGFALCSSASSNDTVADIADKVWAYSQTHPGGFTLDLRTMTEPDEGIAVSYAATQYVLPLVESGKLRLTLPDKPKSTKQKCSVRVESIID